MALETTKIGVIGCGNIAPAYLRAARTFEILEVVACADVDMARARSRAEEFDVPVACTPAELLDRPEIRIVVNLTPPLAHFDVAMACLKAGKCVHNEKPLAATRAEGRKLVESAAGNGLRVGCAPDTFLGAAGQTCRKLIDDGAIGTPVAAAAFLTGRGPGRWHPSAHIFYQRGAGPMFDMGPYYLTALINLLGPVRRVTGSARISTPERTLRTADGGGRKIPIEAPTHVAGVMDFACGAIGTIMTSWDVWRAQLPRIEVYGSEGTLSVPDPNRFAGPVRVFRPGGKDWTEVPHTHGYAGRFRIIGAADMAYALRSGRPHRTSGELAYHVLDIMESFSDASATGRHVELSSTCARPAPLPPGLEDGKLDE